MPSEIPPRAAIVGIAAGGAVAYGVVHDQVTIRICLEYFTVFHPRLVDTEDPTLLALFWGVAATWWFGAGLGVVLAAAGRAGSRPRVAPRALVAPVGGLLLVMAGTAAVAGIAGAALASAGAIRVFPPDLAAAIPKERHVAFLSCLWIHNASYLVGFLGGVRLAWRTWRLRGVPAGGG